MYKSKENSMDVEGSITLVEDKINSCLMTTIE